MSEQHHIYGPSSLERRSLCPWSAKAEAGLPDNPSPTAEAGTRIHAEVAKYITTGEAPALENIAEQEAAEAIAAWWDDFKSRHVILKAEAEKRVSFKAPWGEDIYHGTADVVAETEDMGIYVVDWKTGRSKVEEAESNWQGAAYAAAVMQEHGGEPVTVVFFNPVARQETSCRFDDMAVIAEQIMGAVSRCMSAESDKDAEPGERQCRYCRAASSGTCGAFLRAMSLRLNTPSSPMSEWTDVQVAEEYERVKTASAYMETVKNELMSRCRNNNGEAGGWRLRTKLGARQVKDVAGLFGAVEDVMGEDGFLSVCTVPVGRLESLYVEMRRTAEPDAKLKVKDLKAELAEKAEPFIGRGAETVELCKEDAQ